MRNVFVVRHTESLHHVLRIAGGWLDSPLTEKGLKDARTIAQKLKDEIGPGDLRIFSSDLKRCSETAREFASILKAPVALDSDLREMHGGECEGKPDHWVKEHMAVLSEGNRIDHRAFKGSESRRDVGRRMNAFLDRALATNFQNAVVVTHGFAQSFLVMAWLKIPVEHMDFVDMSRTKPGSVSLLSEDDLWKNRYIVYIGRDFV